jgi:hypothetical protein
MNVIFVKKSQVKFPTKEEKKIERIIKAKLNNVESIDFWGNRTAEACVPEDLSNTAYILNFKSDLNSQTIEKIKERGGTILTFEELKD